MEETWELAAVSAVGDLMTLVQVVEDKMSENPKLQPAAAFQQIAKVTGNELTVHDFVAKYMKAVDVAIDEVIAAPNLLPESKELMVKRLGNFRLLVTTGFSHPNIGAAYSSIAAQGNKENLMLIYSAVVAGGVVSPFTKADAKKNRDSLIQILKNVSGSDMDAFIRQSIVANIESLIGIFSQYEIYGAQDAEKRLKSLNSDLNLSLIHI